MHRQTLLRWTLLPTVTVAIALIVVALMGHGSTDAAANQSNDVTQGSLDVVDQTGKLTGRCPLKHTQVKAEVSGVLSRVTVTQEFENPFADKIEAIYRFPLPQSAAVDDLTMIIGERSIKGKMMRRNEAETAYANAKQLGQVAALLNQERPNIFTQHVANIMPGQAIRITISYVETLQYEAGAYEWSFPMVVGARYIPTGVSKVGQEEEASAQVPVPDASNLPVSEVQSGMRRGQDISIELELDAGIAINDPQSGTHEIEVQRSDAKRASVRLKDRPAIPNKDFVLKYQINAPKMEEGLLAHRSDKGGFFTLILQPPAHVAAEDVMPKELVFVLDTSGSMNGFPLTKAKETIDFALGNLYPHDTFNLITFSGDTQILFSEPEPATPENVERARKFLAERESQGGTEMMKAIKAALEPSDSQQHIRITCFLTDGHVGNDLAIIAEAQQHPKARVFSMGFGPSPNRFLLDKMAEYGRGEVDYVVGAGDTSAVARRFNERIRNPFLTDISVDWTGLPVSDVYPTRIPDLFADKPLILSGRYLSSSRGVVRLKGKIANQEFVRDIPLELPETETRHEVLATLWARRKIDDLMGQDMVGVQSGKMKPSLREEIEQLGLSFRLMTQFTSFVAIDDLIFTEGGEPRRVEVAIQAQPTFLTTSRVASMVMVTSGASALHTSTTSVSSTVESRSLQDLPMQGRSFFNFVSLQPGIVFGSTRPSVFSAALSTSANGQRPDSAVVLVDGVSANFGISPGGTSAGSSAAGSVPAFTASSGANGIAPLSLIQELTVSTSDITPKAGRMPGAHLKLITSSGTNEFHGSLFHYFGAGSLDANDWFANSRGLQRPSRLLNNFGGTLGGPIKRDKSFFFGSYEGLQLRQPMTAITDVPSTSMRLLAPPDLRPFLEPFPVATSEARPDGFAEFASSFLNTTGHNIGSIRLDTMPHSRISVGGRYSFWNSNANARGAGGSSLNTITNIKSRAQTITGWLTHTTSPTVVLDIRANFSHLKVNGGTTLDEFGGASIPIQPTIGTPQSVFAFDLNSRNGSWALRPEAANTQRQFNLVGALTKVWNQHTFELGVDYRRMWPLITSPSSGTEVLFDGFNEIQAGIATRVTRFNLITPQRPSFTNFSLYALDEWRKTSRLTLTYGLRWELNPAAGSDEMQPLAVDQVIDPSIMKLAPRGRALWSTTFGNLAPRFGFAYQVSERQDVLVRGGAGILYDRARN